MANYNSNLHPENDTGSVVFPNINGQSIPENAITPSKVAAGKFPQIVAGSVQNPLTIVTAEGQTEYDGSDAAIIDISSIQDADHAYTADRATADADGNNIPDTYAKQNGSYPTLGAGYLAKQININQSNTGWVQVATVQRNVLPRGGNYSCIMLVNGIYNVQGTTDAAESGIIEIDMRDSGTAIQYYGLTVLCGNINPSEWCITADSNGINVYVNLTANYNRYLLAVVSEGWQTGLNVNYIQLSNTYYGASAPSGAVYAKVKNGADHLVLPSAVGSTTTPVYFNADGVPQPCTLPVSKYYNHTFRYQPSAFVQTSDFSFLFSVVLDVETPIPAGNTLLWMSYLNLPQTSLSPMPLGSKIFPATGVITQDGKVGHIMAVILAAQPLGVNLIASIIYEYNGSTTVYPASNSHVVLDPSRISESIVTP